RIQPDFFPAVFGPEGNEPLDAEIVKQRFAELAERIRAETGDTRSPEEVAEGFRRIAVENMANAIKKISIQRGYDVTKYTLNCFGGAGGQHACDIADTLGMTRIFLHPHAGVLSAYGMGLADLRVIKEQAAEERLKEALSEAGAKLEALEAEARAELQAQGVSAERIEVLRKRHLRYEGTESALMIAYGEESRSLSDLEEAYMQRYGFTMPE